MEEELRVTIKARIQSERAPNSGKHLMERVRALVDKYGPFDLELPPRDAGREPPDFS